MRGIIQDKIYIKKENEQDKLRLGGGCWTINLAEISGKGIEIIKYITAERTYSILFNDAMKKGFVRIFAGEVKLVVPINKWEIKKNE